MKEKHLKAVKVVVTAAVVIAAAFAGHWLWNHYNREPWTRDGRVRADVVLVSPDVNGLVTGIFVHDDQAVHAGDVLFVIDRPRYELALAQAEAQVAADKVALAQTERDVHRDIALGPLVTAEQLERDRARLEQLAAQLNAAIAQRDVGQLNLDRTSIKATVNGVVSNLELQLGDYVAVGHQVMAIVNSDSIYVDGYFEETKLPLIQLGDQAVVRLMGVSRALHGHVEGIDAAIADRERGASANGLANVNPTFSWVRLAQRVPVRIKLDPDNGGVRLIAGRTATVSIEVPADRRREGDE